MQLPSFRQTRNTLLLHCRCLVLPNSYTMDKGLLFRSCKCYADLQHLCWPSREPHLIPQYFPYPPPITVLGINIPKNLRQTTRLSLPSSTTYCAARALPYQFTTMTCNGRLRLRRVPLIQTPRPRMPTLTTGRCVRFLGTYFLDPTAHSAMGASVDASGQKCLD